MYLHWATKAVLLTNEPPCLRNSVSSTNFLSYTKQWTSSSHLHLRCDPVFSAMPHCLSCILPCSSCFSGFLSFFPCICVCGYMCVTVHLCRSESKHLESVLLPLNGSWGVNPGPQTWQQVPLLAEPSPLPNFSFPSTCMLLPFLFPFP